MSAATHNPMIKHLSLKFTSTLVVALSLAAAGSTFAGGAIAEKNVASTAVTECDWSGFYLGINGGVSNYQAKFTDLDYFEGYDTRVLEKTGFIGGGQVGYNFQRDKLVLGLEIDGDGLTGEVHTHTSPYFSSSSYQEDIAKIDFLGTARLRMGVAIQNALIYVTGGGAYAHGNWEERYISSNPINNAYWNGDDSRWGWTGGAGLEYMFNCHWILGAEALYTHLGADTVYANSQYTRNANSRYQFDDEDYSVRVRLSYKFGSFSH